jgi:hypothetical protein
MRVAAYLNTFFYSVFTTKYLTIATIAFLLTGAAILTSSLYSQLDYFIRYQALEEAILEYDPTSCYGKGYSCFPPAPPQSLPYDTSIPWGIAIGTSMLIGGSAVIFSMRGHQKHAPTSGI